MAVEENTTQRGRPMGVGIVVDLMSAQLARQNGRLLRMEGGKEPV